MIGRAALVRWYRGLNRRLFLRQQSKVIRKSGLFDASYYVRSYLSRSTAAPDPLWDFMTIGVVRGRKPNPLFDPAYYLRHSPDVSQNGFNPLYHFALFGQKEGRRPHPLFDPRYYAALQPDDREVQASPLLHYLRHGYATKQNCHPLFDTEFYFRQCPEALESNVNPLLHYLSAGAPSRRSPHPCFDPEYYASQLADASAGDLLAHFVEHGARNGCNPHPFFDTRFYLENNPDVSSSGTNPLVHYVLYGGIEGRASRPRAGQPVTLADWHLRSERTPLIQNVVGYSTATRFAAVREGNGKTLDILFSSGHVRETDFGFFDFPSENTQVFLNATNTDSYQRGIPGLTSSMDDTTGWLKRLIADVKPTTLRIMGESMGGYAALLYGHLLSADCVFVVGPFALLGEPFCRSREWYKQAWYDPKYKDITGLLSKLAKRSRVLFPTYDLREYMQIKFFREWSDSSLFYAPGFHPGGDRMNWEWILASHRTPDFTQGITFASRYPFRYSTDQIDEICQAYVFIRRREHEQALRVLEKIAEIDPSNHGVIYRLGVQQALAGEPVLAVDTLRKAVGRLWRTIGLDLGREQLFGKWRHLIAQDYANVVDLAGLKRLVELFHEVWPASLAADDFDSAAGASADKTMDSGKRAA